jgi:hypothetical protein
MNEFPWNKGSMIYSRKNITHPTRAVRGVNYFSAEYADEKQIIRRLRRLFWAGSLFTKIAIRNLWMCLLSKREKISAGNAGFPG